MLPKGFKDLVKRVIEEDPATSRRLPRTMDTIWKNFVWGVFLDQNRLEAEANYVYDLIDNARLFEPTTIKRLGIKWGEKMCRICQREMRSSVGRKRGILQAVTHDLSVEKATRCVLESVRYFDTMTPKVIRERTKSREAINDLLTEIAYPQSKEHIFNIGLTKTILWLQSFGLGNHLCPPSRQSMKFVEEDLGVRLGREFEEDMGVWSYYFAPFLIEITKAAKEVEKSLNMPVTERDIGTAIWYYKSCQTLVASLRLGLKSRLTPKVVLEFLDSRKWILNDLAERLTNIDEIDELREDLKGFVQT